jgi:hypothetical protein
MDKILILAREVGLLKKQLQSLVQTPPEIHNFIGEKGAIGESGLAGIQGIAGSSGKDGTSGKNGLDGKQGVSVVALEVTFDNHLMITMSDGNEIDAGEITVRSGEVVQVVQNKIGDPNMFSTRYDQINVTLAYKGEAYVGAFESNASWRIQKLVYGVDGDVTITWANGNSDFTNVWDLRESLIYK